MQNLKPLRIVLFLVPTFLLSWGSDYWIARAIGYQHFFALQITPWGMLAPAFVALILRLIIFKDSRIHWSRLAVEPLRIMLAYLVLTILYAAIVVWALLAPGSARYIQGIAALMITLWTLWVIFIGGRADKEALHAAGLQLGDPGMGIRFVLGSMLFFAVQTVLNLVFGFGELRGKVETVFGLPLPDSLRIPALIILFIPVVIIGTPLSGLAATFGEEYGWRGYLQDELRAIGRLPSSLLIGLIWGFWHFPIILAGVHTYPATLLGLLLGLIFFTLWGILQSYAVIKTGSIWTAAFMHGAINSMYAFLSSQVIQVQDRVVSFGLGSFGLVCLAIVVLLVLRDPLWRAE